MISGGKAVIYSASYAQLIKTLSLDSGLYRVEPIERNVLILIKKYGLEAARTLIREEDIDNVAEGKISQLKENKFLDLQPEFVPPTENPITVASLNVSHDCNLSCRYCYGGGGTYSGDSCFMDAKVGELSVDRLFEWSQDKKMVGVTFFGGEPLLNMKVIRHVVQHGTEKAQSEGKDIRFSMTSNGTLFTDEVIDFLNRHKISVLVSMDGPKHVQDLNRPFRGGRGSYDVIRSNVQTLMATRATLTARATLTKDCMSLHTVVQGLREVGFRYVHIEPVTCRSPFALDEKDFETLKREYDQLGEVFLENVSLKSPFGFSNILRTISAIYKASVRHYPCGAGKNIMAVDPEGGLHLCHRFTGMDEFSMGTLEDPDFSLQKKILQKHVDAREKCRHCWARHLCGGSCWHENYVYTGYIDEPYEPRCNLFKHVAALSMVIFSRLHEKDRELLDKMFRKNEPLHRSEDLPEETQKKKEVIL